MLEIITATTGTNDGGLDARLTVLIVVPFNDAIAAASIVDRAEVVTGIVIVGITIITFFDAGSASIAAAVGIGGGRLLYETTGLYVAEIGGVGESGFAVFVES